MVGQNEVTIVPEFEQLKHFIYSNHLNVNDDWSLGEILVLFSANIIGLVFIQICN